MTRAMTRSRRTIQQTSALLNLPPELRDRIYHFALLSEHPITIQPMPSVAALLLTKKRLPPFWQRECTSRLPREPSLLQVCVEIREEATPMYYGANIFHSTQRLALKVWLHEIGSWKRKLLKRVHGFCIDPDILGTTALSECLFCIRQVDKDLADEGLAIPKDAFRFARGFKYQVTFLNATEVVSQMTEQDWEDFYEREEATAGTA